MLASFFQNGKVGPQLVLSTVVQTGGMQCVAIYYQAVIVYAMILSSCIMGYEGTHVKDYCKSQDVLATAASALTPLASPFKHPLVVLVFIVVSANKHIVIDAVITPGQKM